MITRLARRLGFRPSIPASAIDGWLAPRPIDPPTRLGALGSPRAVLVDDRGRVQVEGESWSLDWTIAGGVRFVPVSDLPVSQRLDPPAVVESTYTTPAGPVVARVAVAMAGGSAAALVEIDNNTGVAIALGAAARPLTLDGRGFLPRVAVELDALRIDDTMAIGFSASPGATRVGRVTDGDLLTRMPAPDAGATPSVASCRSGGAQVAAVWPLAPRGSLRLLVGDAATLQAGVALPSAEQVNRGWLQHLAEGLQVRIEGLDVAAALQAATRSLLTAPADSRIATAVVPVLAELGHGREAERWIDALEAIDGEHGAKLSALARWVQLAAPEEAKAMAGARIGTVARAAHALAAGAPTPRAPWSQAAYRALAGRLGEIEQPDVAERVASLAAELGDVSSDAGSADLDTLMHQADDRWCWPGGADGAAAFASATRSAIVADRGSALALLPGFPPSWRGRAIDVIGAPIAGGSISFGVRWHGPRPALLWEADPGAPEEFRLTVPAIDPTFESTDSSGEALLADPGWSR